MSTELQSHGTWSVVINRAATTLIRPGAPLHITGISISYKLQPPKNNANGVLRSVLYLSSRLRGAPPDASTTVVVAALVPEKTENHDCDIRLFPHKEYTFEISGSDVHIFGEFIGVGPALDFPKTEMRKIMKPPTIKRTAAKAPLPLKAGIHQGGTSGVEGEHYYVDEFEQGSSIKPRRNWGAGVP